ncbi:hypothetical protein Ancab_034102, partial [Ancistrocladus abbreviatus]
ITPARANPCLQISSTYLLKYCRWDQVCRGYCTRGASGIPRIEIRHFISFYEEEEARDETLLRFAKIDYNMLQILHQ